MTDNTIVFPDALSYWLFSPVALSCGATSPKHIMKHLTRSYPLILNLQELITSGNFNDSTVKRGRTEHIFTISSSIQPTHFVLEIHQPSLDSSDLWSFPYTRTKISQLRSEFSSTLNFYIARINPI